jgi:hypothetical protein
MARKHMKVPASVLAVFIGLTCLHVASAQVRSIPALRDPTVSTVAYSEFDGRSPEEIWQIIEGLEFWAIPGPPPTGFYGAIDANSQAGLRKSLHALLRSAAVFRYTHNSKPGDPNFTVDTWDIIALADAHPTEPGMVLDIYMNATFPRQLAGPQGGFKYDREHSWPKSLGFRRMPSRIHHTATCITCSRRIRATTGREATSRTATPRRAPTPEK